MVGVTYTSDIGHKISNITVIQCYSTMPGISDVVYEQTVLLCELSLNSVVM